MALNEYYRVLIVDDELLIRQGIKHYLNWEQEGFSIVGEAANGQEALALIEKTQPHILLTDIVMPIMDGEELTKIVKERYPSMEIIILSSFGEFDYVRSTFQSGVVDYILKPKLDAQGLLSALKKAAGRIQGFTPDKGQSEDSHTFAQSISKLISGYEVEMSESMLKTVMPHSQYCLIGLELNEEQDQKEGFLTRLREKLARAGEQPNPGLIPYIFDYDKNLIVIIVNFNGLTSGAPNSLAKMIAAEFPRIGVSLTETFTEFSEIGKIFKGSLAKLRDYRFFFPELPVISSESLPADPGPCDPFNLDRFTAELKAKDFDSAFSYLMDHAEKLSRCYTVDVFEYKAFFGNIIFNISILLTNMEYDVKELEKSKYHYFQNMNDTKNARQPIGLLKQFIEEARKVIHSAPIQQEDVTMKQIIHYMREHYAEPLTLTEVAKHFHFNPSYFSSYFSTHNNEGFIEYLNKIRIEEAARLLTNAEAVPISEVSSLVGYSDHSYFCKVFKKAKGSSPSQFRRKQSLR